MRISIHIEESTDGRGLVSVDTRGFVGAAQVGEALDGGRAPTGGPSGSLEPTGALDGGAAPVEGPAPEGEEGGTIDVGPPGLRS